VYSLTRFNLIFNQKVAGKTKLKYYFQLSFKQKTTKHPAGRFQKSRIQNFGQFKCEV